MATKKLQSEGTAHQSTGQVYIESRINGWGLHSLYREIINYPPEGYRFIANLKSPTGQSRFYPINRQIISFSLTKFMYDYFRPQIYYFALSMQKRELYYDLIYASQHVVSYKQPWVVDLEHAGALAAYGKTTLVKKAIEKAFRSPWCKKIMPWSIMAKKSLIHSFNCSGLEDKIEVVNLAVHPKSFEKKYGSKKLRILFVGTANPSNIKESFDLKGGREVLKAFKALKNSYKDIELVIRSYIPEYIKLTLKNWDDVIIIDQLLSAEELATIFESADIFLFPGHNTPGMVILDAMSYELPVIATDVWGNYELVKDGETGFLVPKPEKIRYFDENFIPVWGEPNFMLQIREPDDILVNELVRRIELLIEDPKLRMSMGKAGRREVEIGKFSIKKRNQKLQTIFNEAIGKQVISKNDVGSSW